MTEHDDLKLFRVRRSEQKRDQLQDPLEGNVKDGQNHGFSPTESRYFMLIELTHRTPSTLDELPNAMSKRVIVSSRPLRNITCSPHRRRRNFIRDGSSRQQRVGALPAVNDPHASSI